MDRILKVVVVYPSDAKRYKDTVEPTANRVSRRIENLGEILNLRVSFQVYSWDTDAYPGLHPNGAQGQIDACLRINDCDLVIAIFANRLGTSLEDGKSGTEHELEIAETAFLQAGRPQIMHYFKRTPDDVSTGENAKEWLRLMQFKEHIAEGLYRTYEDVDQFREELGEHLEAFVFSIIKSYSKSTRLAFVISAHPEIVRYEGVSERVGDVFIDIAGLGPKHTARLDAVCYLNTNVTNSLGDDACTTDAVILHSQDKADKRVLSRATLTKGRTDCLVFRNIPVDPAVGPIQRLTISGIRACAGSLASSCPISCYVVGSVRIDNNTEPIQFAASVTVAMIHRGLDFDVDCPNGGPLELIEVSIQSGVLEESLPDWGGEWRFVLHYKPAFSGAIKSKKGEAGPITLAGC